MPSQKIEPQHRTTPSYTFAARKAILTALTESQAKEHAYYAAAAEAVGTHMQALCAAWIALLLNQTDGTAAADDRFFRATGIRLDQLNAWRTAHRAYAHAETELTDAQNELTAAEQMRSKFAGILWGAKKGFEQEYAARDQIVKRAKANLEHERTRVAGAERSLDASSEALLRDCIGKSAIVSTSTEFGLDIARALRTMQAEAHVLQQKHNEEQRELLGTAARAFGSLAGHYPKS